MHRVGHQRAAHQDQRPFRLGDPLGQIRQILRAGRGGDTGARRVDRRVGLLIEDILRQDHRHRPRRSALGDMEGARHRLGRHFRLIHLDHQLGDVGEQHRVILLLQREAAEIRPLHLPDQHHQRRRVVIGGMQRDQSVGEAGTTAHHRHPGPVPKPPVRRRHESRPRLVPADDDPGRVPLHQCAGEPDIAFTGNAKNLVDIMGFQAIRQEAGNGLGHAASFSADDAEQRGAIIAQE
jgi:hypothetical protein